MNSLERIPNVVGYLILTEDGAVISSYGELENDERSANVVTGLIQLTESVDPLHFNKSSCRRISIVCEGYNYVICQSNKKIYVVKRKNPIQFVPEDDVVIQ